LLIKVTESQQRRPLIRTKHKCGVTSLAAILTQLWHDRSSYTSHFVGRLGLLQSRPSLTANQKSFVPNPREILHLSFFYSHNTNRRDNHISRLSVPLNTISSEAMRPFLASGGR